MVDPGARPTDAIAELQRWVDSGGRWQVHLRTPASVVVALSPCTGGEVVALIESGDPAFLRHLDHLLAADDPA